MLRWFAAVSLIAGCNAELPSLMCGPGTMRVGDQCVPADPGYDAGMPEEGDDAGTGYEGDAGMPPEGYDAGDEWNTGGPSNPGCDEGAGECDAWEAELLAALRASCAAMAADPGVGAVADQQTQYQADIDRITATSPRGTVFDQLEARDIAYTEAAVLFSVTRTGAADVLARWRSSADSSAMLSRCYDDVGVAFHTSASGASYTTVVFVDR